MNDMLRPTARRAGAVTQESPDQSSGASYCGSWQSKRSVLRCGCGARAILGGLDALSPSKGRLFAHSELTPFSTCGPVVFPRRSRMQAMDEYAMSQVACQPGGGHRVDSAMLIGALAPFASVPGGRAIRCSKAEGGVSLESSAINCFARPSVTAALGRHAMNRHDPC